MCEIAGEIIFRALLNQLYFTFNIDKMLSRIADSLYWMTRYVERADGILRMLRINFITSLDRGNDFSWHPVLKIFTYLDDETIDKMALNGDDVLRFMILNKDNPNSIRNIVGHARENARGMQDHVTKEVWECLNTFYHKVNNNDVEKAIQRDEQITVLGDLIDNCLLFIGVSEMTMPRGQGWNYMNLGKFIERGLQTVDILDVRFSNIDYDLNNPADIPYWRNLLLSLSGYELYLKRYRGGLQSRNVADLAIMTTEFPRSVLYCIIRLDRVIRGMSNENLEATPQLQKIIGRLRGKVEYADIDSISEMGLHAFLSDVRVELFNFSKALSTTYFSYN